MKAVPIIVLALALALTDLSGLGAADEVVLSCQPSDAIFSGMAHCVLRNGTDSTVTYWTLDGVPDPDTRAYIRDSWHVPPPLLQCGNGVRPLELAPGESMEFDVALVIGGEWTSLSDGRPRKIKRRWRGPLKFGIRLKLPERDDIVEVWSNELEGRGLAS